LVTLFLEIRGFTKPNNANIKKTQLKNKADMNYKTFQLHFSTPRVNRYYYAAGSSKKKAISFYKQNLLVTQAIHPVIGIFEVILRNSIYSALSMHFQDEDWIINQKDGFMSDSHLLFMGKQ